jgi:DNA primase
MGHRVSESERHSVSAVDFYTESVLPALAERLDEAFPEFGWRRDARGWVATNQEHTHSLFGVRADRVVAHGPAPRGFLIHGGDPTLWTVYLSGGTSPRGADFVRVAGELARRAGVDPAPIEQRERPDRRAQLLDRFVELGHDELLGSRGSRAREYLQHRGLPSDAITSSDLGVVPETTQTRTALRRAGFGAAEIEASGVCADSRWPGRLCGPWRTASGRPGTVWARSIDANCAAAARYLYLRGASRTDLPPYGLSQVLSGPRGVRSDLVLVEGVFDLLQLRGLGIDNCAALGGSAISSRTFEQLIRLGVERVTLCLDRDAAGRAATARAVENAARARRSPAVSVVDPERLAPAKDPDELIRTNGVSAWRALLATRQCGVAWRANELLGEVTVSSDQDARRHALERVGSWLGTLPARLALEQEDALRLVSERCGYSAPAVERAFRARFWRPPSLDRGWTL